MNTLKNHNRYSFWDNIRIALGIIRSKFFNYRRKGFYTLLNGNSSRTVTEGTVTIAPGAIIIPESYALANKINQIESADIFIGNNVFIGANVVVLPGVKIGDNSIIGTGAVIYDDVPDGTVVVGNPAIVVGNANDYIAKCTQRDVLYDVPDFVVSRHGKSIGYTSSEMKIIEEYLMDQYNEKK